MNLFAYRKQLDALLLPLVSIIARLPVSANQWTGIGVVVGCFCAYSLMEGYLFLGCALLLLRGLCDHLDGYVARNKNDRSTFGAILDDTADRWILGIVFCGGCLHLANSYSHALLLMGLGISGALANVIIKSSIYAEAPHESTRVDGKLKHPVDVVGVFGSAEFIIYFGLGILVSALIQRPWPMLVGAWLVVLLSHFSLFQRMVFAWRRYRSCDPKTMFTDQGQ